APNTSFVERDENVRLQGYDDRAQVVRVRDTPDGAEHAELRRDFRELVPLVRFRQLPAHPAVERLLNRDRNVRLTVDVRLERQAARILEKPVRAAGVEKGALVVVDPVTGDLLASATYPWVGALTMGSRLEEEPASGTREPPDPSLFDRPRFGLYPPGSSFK